jgi:tetratricopeptide (TPR) repeat protein
MLDLRCRIIACVGATAALFTLCHPAVAQKTGGPPPALTATQEAAAQKAFQAANQALEQKRYAEAVTEYKKVLALLPDDTSTLWNCGMAAYSAKDYPTSLQCWKRLRSLLPRVPDDETFTVAKVSAKLIQVYQSMGDKPAREKERAALVLLRNSKVDPALTKQSSFCCDQFTVDGKSVFAYDHFALTGKLSIRYEFLVTKPEGTVDYRVVLECNPDTNALSRELGEIKPNERLFSVDGFYDGGRTHRTFGFLLAKAAKLPADPTAANPAPPYETVKALVIQVIHGKIKTVTSSTSDKP